MSAQGIIGFGLLAALALLGGALVFLWGQGAFIRREFERQLASQRLWARALGDASLDGLLIHRQGVILFMNSALTRLLGVREREWLGQNFATLARGDEVATFRAMLEAPGPEMASFHLLRANKTELLVEIASRPLEFDGQPATATALRDISRHAEDAAKIASLAHYDPLTNLPNRAYFTQLLRQAVAANDQGHGTVTLFLADIDQFKRVNEQHGRDAGDLLLRQFAERLRAMLAKDDIFARLGSDKFALLLPAASAPNRGLSLGGQIMAACGEPFIIQGQLVTLQLSIGLALCPDHAADAAQLMAAAEQALAQAARAGGGRLHMFRHEDVARLRAAPVVRETPPPPDPAHLRDEVRSAIGHGEIRLLYQPIYNLRDMSLAGFEALPRWQHPLQGLLVPEQFMKAAEEAGLALELGAQLIERACTEAHASGAPRVELGIGAPQLQDPHWFARLQAVLRKTALKPEQFEIELSEPLLAARREQALSLITALRAQNIGVVLGDFGSGASSLGALVNLPVTRVKLDRRFTQKLGQDPTADAIVAASLSLAANLHLTVIAPGIEQEAQLTQLRAQGCHTGQGPLLGEPASRAVARATMGAAVS